MAKLLLGCYRTGDANDPEVYSDAVIAVLSDYPLEIIKRVVDPRSGIPSVCSWLPTIAEIKKALEAEMAPIRREEDRREREQLYRLQQEPEPDRTHRPTYDELKAKYGDWSKELGPPKRDKPDPFSVRQIDATEITISPYLRAALQSRTNTEE
jgi:hypothetical protein